MGGAQRSKLVRLMKSLPSPLLPSSPLPSPLLPFEIGSFNTAERVWGSTVTFPSGVWSEAPAIIDSGAFSLKILHPVTPTSIIFPRESTNQISRSLNSKHRSEPKHGTANHVAFPYQCTNGGTHGWCELLAEKQNEINILASPLRLTLYYETSCSDCSVRELNLMLHQ